MKPIQLSGDVRLAVPVTGAWILLAIANTLAGDKTLSPLVIQLSVVLLLVFAIVVMRRIPLLGLFCFVSISFLLSWSLRAVTHIDSSSWSDPSAAQDDWWTSWAVPIRAAFLQATEDFPGVGGQLIPGLAIGDTSRVSESLSTAMKTVSLTHITAVSGANCVIVTASCIALAALCGLHKNARLVAGAVGLITFVILVTPQPSVLRAAAMALIVMFALSVGRPSSGIPLLAITVVILLLWDPWLSVDFGLILSASATAGLLLFSEPIARSLTRWIPYWLAVVLAVPFSAQLACQPFIILLTPTIPTFGVLANVVAGPAAPLATIVGLLACLLIMWVPALAVPLLWIAWLPAQWIGITATTFEQFPAAQISWFSGLFGAVMMLLVSIAILLLLISPRKPVRRLSGLALSLFIVCWGAVNLVQDIRFTHTLPPSWDIAACDVGQGDGLILRSENKIAVIDVGRKPEPMSHCLHQLGVSRIDLLVLTHFDKDHVGGLSAVLGKVDLAVVGKPENLEDQSLLDDLNRSGAQVVRGLSGMKGSLGVASWKVLWPDGKHPLMEMGNPGSVTLLVTFPKYSALFLGDLGEEAQRALMGSGHLANVQVVKVAHHGSADQSPELYELLHPDIGILSVGAGNDYGHPRQETLEILNALHAQTPRTDKDGLVLITSTSTGLSVWTEH